MNGRPKRQRQRTPAPSREAAEQAAQSAPRPRAKITTAPQPKRPRRDAPPRLTPLTTLHGLRLQLPIPLQIATAEGVKEGMLVAGDFDHAQLRVQFGDDVATPSKAAKLATGKSSELNGLLMWKWSPSPGELYSLHQMRAAGVWLESATSLADAAEELVVLAAAAPRRSPKEKPPEPRSLEGLRLQLPLPLQIKTPDGMKDGTLVAGDFEGGRLRVRFGDDEATPSMAAKIATGKSIEVNGLLVWKWNPSPGELYSLHRMRAAGVVLEGQPAPKPKPARAPAPAPVTGASDAAEELAVLAAAVSAEPRSLKGLRLQLPLPLQIKTPDGMKDGTLVAGDFEGGRLRVRFGDDEAAPSKAAKIATGKSTEVNGLLLWKWNPSPGELYSLHQMRAAGVILEAPAAAVVAQPVSVALPPQP